MYSVLMLVMKCTSTIFIYPVHLHIYCGNCELIFEMDLLPQNNFDYLQLLHLYRKPTNFRICSKSLQHCRTASNWGKVFHKNYFEKCLCFSKPACLRWHISASCHRHKMLLYSSLLIKLSHVVCKRLHAPESCL